MKKEMSKLHSLYENDLVKFNGYWWVLHKDKGEMVILWRNGERALAPKKEIEYLKNR